MSSQHTSCVSSLTNYSQTSNPPLPCASPSSHYQLLTSPIQSSVLMTLQSPHPDLVTVWSIPTDALLRGIWFCYLRWIWGVLGRWFKCFSFRICTFRSWTGGGGLVSRWITSLIGFSLCASRRCRLIPTTSTPTSTASNTIASTPYTSTSSPSPPPSHISSVNPQSHPTFSLTSLSHPTPSQSISPTP